VDMKQRTLKQEGVSISLHDIFNVNTEEVYIREEVYTEECLKFESALVI